MSTLVRMSESEKNGWTHIIVETAHAENLYRELRPLRLRMTPLQNAVSDIAKAGAGADERKRAAAEALAKAFEIQATPKSLEPMIGRWLKTLH